MSWTFSFQVESADAVASEGAKARSDYFDQGHWPTDDALDESIEQADTAIDAAQMLAGATGKRLIAVNLSGHANPGHLPRPGWVDEVITVNVREVA